MRQVLNDIEAGRLTEDLARRGIPPGRRLRVIVESLDDDELSTCCARAPARRVTAISAAGGAFDWLADEPDLYGDRDLVERYRK